MAGHYTGPGSLLRTPDTAVLAVFDSAGVQLSRTELDGAPDRAVVVGDHIWIVRGNAETVSLIDAADGRQLGQVHIAAQVSEFAAFGSLWVEAGYERGNQRLMRIDPDLTTTTVELPDRVVRGEDLPSSDVQYATAGPDAIWVPLAAGGVAVVNPATLAVTVIPVVDIGHEVTRVGFDGDAAYVANDHRVTSIVDGRVVATVSPGGVRYLGHVDGAFGVLLPDGLEGKIGLGKTGGVGQVTILRANDPMAVEQRQVAVPVQARGGIVERDGETWWEVGRNYSQRRVHLLPASGADG
jgi:hypothetical protein